MWYLVSGISILIPFFAGLALYHFLNFNEKRFLIFLGFSVVAEATGLILNECKINNILFLHFFTIVEYAFISYTFHGYLRNMRFKRYISLSVFVFIIFYLVYLFLDHGWFVYNTVQRAVESLLLTCCSILLFNQIMKFDVESDIPVIKLPEFWFSVSVFAYFLGNFLLFAFYDTISKVEKELLWRFIHSISNTMCNIIFALVFILRWKIKKQ